MFDSDGQMRVGAGEQLMSITLRAETASAAVTALSWHKLDRLHRVAILILKSKSNPNTSLSLNHTYHTNPNQYSMPLYSMYH